MPQSPTNKQEKEVSTSGAGEAPVQQMTLPGTDSTAVTNPIDDREKIPVDAQRRDSSDQGGKAELSCTFQLQEVTKTAAVTKEIGAAVEGSSANVTENTNVSVLQGGGSASRLLENVTAASSKATATQAVSSKSTSITVEDKKVEFALPEVVENTDSQNVDAVATKVLQQPTSQPQQPPQQDSIQQQVSFALETETTTTIADPQEALLAVIRQQRAPLTDMYHPYICPCDTSIDDARMRLQTALEQTRLLRKAFTERVYGKYRVCLVPPPPTLLAIVRPIQQNPSTCFAQLQDEMEQIRLEKEIEKKEAVQLNTELAKSPSTASLLNIDHAEQLMYLSAGLNLVILPEDDKINPEVLHNYNDGRGPMQESGQRNRAISHAAAVSGDAILDRTRRAMAMREERQRQTFQDSSKEATSFGESKIAATTTATTAPTTTGHLAAVLNSQQSPGTKLLQQQQLQLAERQGTVGDSSTVTAPTISSGKPRAEAASSLTNAEALVKAGAHTVMPVLASTRRATTGSTSAKNARMRTTAILPASSLLSLHPHSDQLDASERLTASTAALISCGIGLGANPNHNNHNNVAANVAAKSNQLRLRHPYPESLGGRRRVGNNSSNIEENDQTLLNLTLPPLPTTKDRLERKSLAVLSPEEAGTMRAKKAIQYVLDPFQGGIHSTKGGTKSVGYTSLLHHLWKSSAANSTDGDAATNNSTGIQGETLSDVGIDPHVAFLVLSALGIIGQSCGTDASETLEQKLKALPSVSNNEALDQMRLDLSCSARSLTETFQGHDGMRKRIYEAEGESAKRMRPSLDQSTDNVEKCVEQIPVESIRGGGGENNRVSDNDDDGGDSNNQGTREANPAQYRVGMGVLQGSASVPSNLSSSSTSVLDPVAARLMLAPTAPGYLTTPQGRYHAASGLNALHLAQQLQTTTFRNPPSALATSNPSYLSNVAVRQGLFVPTPPPNADRIPASSQLALGVARQNQVMAEARASFTREQQAATFHGANTGFIDTGNALYQLARGAHPSAIAALLGNPSNQYLPHPQGSVRTPVATQFTQPNLPTHTPPEKERDSLGDRSLKPTNTFDTTLRREVPKAHKQAESFERNKSEDRSISRESETKCQSNNKPSPARAKTAPLNPENIEKTEVKEGKAETQAFRSASISIDKKVGEGATNEKTMESKSANAGSEPSNCEQKTENPAGIHVKSDISACSTERPNKVELGLVAPIVMAERSTTTGRSLSDGLKFVSPETPPLLDENESNHVRLGRFHSVVADNTHLGKSKAALDYLLSVSSAVPIPKALIMNTLKDCMSLLGLNSSISSGTAAINRDVVASALLVWLWANHESSFQNAFTKSGRIDVDPDCKWLIETSANVAYRDLVDEVVKEHSPTHGLYAQLATARKLLVTKKQGGTTDSMLENTVSALASSVDICTASVVSRALAKQLSIDIGCNELLPKFYSLLSYLDEARLVALQCKARERALLANLISRKTTMTESFSHAYVSSMVRAGEAIGHGKLFEVVQNESLGISAMMPYDIFSDETTEWEDPCKPLMGMTLGLNADDLTRRAHARAMLQKSLKKLQGKHNIKGGTPSSGPYADPASINNNKSGSGAGKLPPASPRVSLKRKYSSSLEPPVPPGTGSAKATSWAVFNPRHVSEPLEWNPTLLEVLPYGKHCISDHPRSVPHSLIARSGDAKRLKKPKLPDDKKTPTALSGAATQLPQQQQQQQQLSQQGDDIGWQSEGAFGFPRSTLEIPWSEVADIFQRVELPKKSSTSRSSSSSGVHPHHHNHESTPLPVDGKIFAPFCLKVDPTMLWENHSDSEEESETEEDTSEQATLARHEAVLGRMKFKLSQYMEEKRKQQDRRKSRSSAPSKGRS